MESFIYESHSPEPYCHLQRNKITVRKEDGQLIITRQYLPKDKADPLSKGIDMSFPADMPWETIAELVHWGCSGTSKLAWKLESLKDNLQALKCSLNEQQEK